jgi:hypothetical protein
VDSCEGSKNQGRKQGVSDETHDANLACRRV